ncbi:unnamed protein product [Effrenium voratum]|nr:unnamed protein product [Effrenium voratum]
MLLGIKPMLISGPEAGELAQALKPACVGFRRWAASMFCYCCDAKQSDMELKPVDVMPVLEREELVEKREPQEPVQDATPEAKAASPPAKAPEPKAVDSGVFTASIAMPEKPRTLGLEWDDIDAKGPMIVGFSEGIVLKFNQDQPAKALRVYDRITSVKGAFGHVKKLCSSLQAAMEKDDELVVTVTRPKQLSISVAKGDEPLGAQLNFKDSSAGLTVVQVADGGALAKWNTANPENAILPGDRVIKINGKLLKGGQMVEAFKKETTLELTLLRY